MFIRRLPPSLATVPSNPPQQYKRGMFRIQGGINIGYLTIIDTFEPENTRLRTSYHVGIAGEYRMHRRIGIQLGLQYSRQGIDNIKNCQSSLSWINRIEEKRKKIQLDYLYLPCTIRWYPSTQANICCLFGWRIGYTINGSFIILDNYKARIGSNRTSKQTITNLKEQGYINNFDSGWHVGIDYTTKIGLLLGAVFNFSIIDIFTKKLKRINHTENKLSHRVLQIFVGYTW